MNTKIYDVAVLAGRVLIAFLFISAGWSKIGQAASVRNTMKASGHTERPTRPAFHCVSPTAATDCPMPSRCG